MSWSALPLTQTIVDRVTALVPANAAARQRGSTTLAAFPSEDIAALRDAGVLALPLPIEQDPGATMSARPSISSPVS